MKNLEVQQAESFKMKQKSSEVNENMNNLNHLKRRQSCIVRERGEIIVDGEFCELLIDFKSEIFSHDRR